ncbi:MAG: hypothetical protein N4A47_03590 [Clostridia bacterium]|jgi:hypothetical protein|nr:hypothetical protein [Clostridia bacterium]
MKLDDVFSKLKDVLDNYFTISINDVEVKADIFTKHHEEVIKEGNKEVIRKYELTMEEGTEILRKLISEIEQRSYEDEGSKVVDTKIKEIDGKGKFKTKIIKKKVHTVEDNVISHKTKVIKLHDKGLTEEIHTEYHHDTKTNKKKKMVNKKSSNSDGDHKEIVLEYEDGSIKHKISKEAGSLTSAIGKYEPTMYINEGKDKLSFRFNKIVDGKGKGVILSTGKSKDHVFKNVNENIEKLKEMLKKDGVEIHEDSNIAHVDDDAEIVLGTLRYLLHHMIFDLETLEEEFSENNKEQEVEEDEFNLVLFEEEL